MGPDDKNQFDAWLDRALRQYGDAEPRAGLERRILANLESVPCTAGVNRGWAWWFGAAALAACLGLAFWIGSTNFAKKPVANATPAPTPAVNVERAYRAQPSVPAAHVVAHHASRRAVQPRVTKDPCLATFPSPRPLSEQEQLLVSYAERFPQEAVMVAQAQLKRREELDRLFADEFSKIDSDQQER